MSATVALWVTRSSRATEDMGAIPDTGRYIGLVGQITDQNGISLSLGHVYSGRLKNPSDFDRWSFLGLCLST